MRKRLKRILPALLPIALAIAFLAYAGDYYHADETALAALPSGDAVQVEKTDYGWFFDGPSEEAVLIFYPGAKVQTEAYAPMLRLLASGGMDACLVDMPFRLAFFGVNKADGVRAQYDYDRWYIGGHSLGGAMAAVYAADHELDGVVLCAAYPTKTLDEPVLSIYGSCDGVLNRDKLAEGMRFADTEERIIEGGNHAQFGNYGAQAGDGEAAVSAEEQQRLTVRFVLNLENRRADEKRAEQSI